MRKIFASVLLAIFMISPAFAEGNLKVGFLTRLKTTPEEFYRIIKNSWTTRGWAVLGGDHSNSTAKFYDNLMLMQMALNSGGIDEMILPDFSAEYLLSLNPEYSPSCVASSGVMNLCFGFMKDNEDLRSKWNSALLSMKNDYTLAGLEQRYIKNFSDINVKFERFKDSPTVRVALTGDLPPVDFVGDDGLPAGYSVAVLSEIGRRLHLNIEIINVNAGARTAALVSGRCDVVFWYEVNKSLTFQPDVGEDVILSEPYFSWDKFIHVKLGD